MAASGAPWPAAVGVSGGSDSLGLMLLLRDWAKARGLKPPAVLCVDHGLRPESAAEARRVVRWAKKAGLAAHVLKEDWQPPRSGLEAAARSHRYRLMGGFARQHKLAAVYVAHTRDDQAETLLLRLARGSGVDGLSGMRAVAPFPDEVFRSVKLVRPLLAIGRAEIRASLEEQGHPWLDDPMNGDTRFARVRIRTAWPQLAALGLTPERLAETAVHLGRARNALETASCAILARACRRQGEGLVVDPGALAGAPPELGLRALASILMLVSGNPYRPRFEALSALYAALIAGSLGGGRTLHGCRIGPAPQAARSFGGGTLLVRREKSHRVPGKNHRPGQEVLKRPGS
jgi:tRNA(Ile)-lysidine synthase